MVAGDGNRTSRHSAAANGGANGAAPPAVSPWPRALAYAFAAAAPGVVLAMMAVFPDEQPVLVLLAVPILLAAFVGGLGPGLVATAVSAVASLVLLLSPDGSLVIAGDANRVRWIGLVVTGVLASVLVAARRRQPGRDAAVTDAMLAATQHKLQAGFVFALGAVTVIGVIAYGSTLSARRDQAWVAQTREVIAALGHLPDADADAVAAYRAFVITGDARFVDAYREATTRIDANLQALRRLRADNAAQQRRVERLAAVVGEGLRFAAEMIEVRRGRGFDAARTMMAGRRVDALQEPVDEVIDEIDGAERRLLAEREAALRDSEATTQTLIAVAGVLAFVVVAVSVLVLRRDMARTARNQAGLRQTRDELANRVREDSAELETSRERLDLVLDAADIGTWEWNVVSGELVWSARCLALYGLEPDMAMSYQRFLEAVHPDDRDEVDGAVLDALEEHREFRVEMRSVWPDRSTHWVALRGRAYFDAAGRAIRMRGAAFDISERKRAETTLRDSEERLRFFIEYAPAGLAMFDRDMRYIFASRRWRADYGLGERELRGLSHYEVFPDVSTAWREAHSRGLAGEVVGADAERFERADGSMQWIRWEIRPWYDADGGIGGIVIFSEDVSERERAEIALRQARAQLDTVIDNLDEGLVIFDLEGRVTRANRAVLTIFGSDAGFGDRRRMEQFAELFRLETPAGEPLPADQWPAARVLRGEQLRDVEAVVRRTDPGWRRIFSFSGTLVRSPDGKPLLGFLSMADVTARKEAETALLGLTEELERRVAERTVELAAARDAAEGASRAKSQFLANMSHELRTPLNSLLILSQLLAENTEGNLSAAQRRYAQTIYRSGTDLLTLIGDLLDLAKIEAGRLVLHIETVSIANLCDSIERTFAPLAAEKGLAFAVLRGAGLPEVLFTDGLRLEQTLRNLLANAIKFTPRGRVALRIEAVASGWNARHAALDRATAVIAFRVEDTGIGIAADKQQLIFEAFEQAEAGTARSYGGTGLGLSISREIVHLLGGEITLSSEPGRGSTFTVFLPDAPVGVTGADGRPAEANAPEPVEEATLVPTRVAPEIAAGLRNRTVLVVDDDVRNLFSVSALLERQMRVVCAESGAEAIAALQRNPDISVVLMDIMMPGMDGLATTRAIRASGERHATLPIIALTAKAMPGDDAACLAAGCSDYLAKPVDSGKLLERIAAWIER